MKPRILIAWFLAVISIHAQEIIITSFGNGQLTWTNSAPDKTFAYTVEWVAQVDSTHWLSSWRHLDNIASSSPGLSAEVPMFCRIKAYAFNETTNDADLLLMYSNAVVDAAIALPGKVCHTLSVITESNTNLQWWTNGQGISQVKVASFMRYETATNFYALGDHSLGFGDQWVTTYPDLKNFCHGYLGRNPLLGIKQALGMPPTSENNTVVEFWVSPAFLLRPSPDPEINDPSAGLVTGTASPLLTANTMLNPNYVVWFNDTYASRNYGMTNGVYTGWPWTRLGYTYDWASPLPKHVGLSEFVIPSGMLASRQSLTVPIEVVNITGAATYGR